MTSQAQYENYSRKRSSCHSLATALVCSKQIQLLPDILKTNINSVK